MSRVDARIYLGRWLKHHSTARIDHNFFTRFRVTPNARFLMLYHKITKARKFDVFTGGESFTDCVYDRLNKMV